MFYAFRGPLVADPGFIRIHAPRMPVFLVDFDYCFFKLHHREFCIRNQLAHNPYRHWLLKDKCVFTINNLLLCRRYDWELTLSSVYISSYNCWFLRFFILFLTIEPRMTVLIFILHQFPVILSISYARRSACCFHTNSLIIDLFLFSFIAFYGYSKFNSDPDCHRRTFQTFVCFRINRFYGLFIFPSVYTYNGRTHVTWGHKHYF